MSRNPAPGSAASSGSPAGAAGLDPAAEIARLRAIIEKQPSCLVRVGADGALLAASDAALSLLGARELAQVLGTSLLDCLSGDAVLTWSEFAERVLHSGSASAECEMTDLAGTRRAIVLLGVALPDHPDGLPSLLVTVRDVSTARRLETSLEEQRAKLATALADRQRLEPAAAERDRLQAALDEAVANLQRLQQQLEQAKAERRQLHSVLEQAVAQRQQVMKAFDELTNALNAAVTAAKAAGQALGRPASKSK